MTTSHLATLPCTVLQGVGSQIVARLQKLQVYTVQDLLFHLPLRYEDQTRLTPIREVKLGHHVVVEGIITDIQSRQGRRPSLLCCLEDESGGRIFLRFFNATKAQQEAFMRDGQRLRCYGEARFDREGLGLIHPKYRFVKLGQPLPIDDKLTPVYPTTEGLHQVSLRKLVDQSLQLLQESDSQVEYLPKLLLKKLAYVDLKTALEYVHRPPMDAPREQLALGQHPTQQRLAFEELLAHQLSMRLRRRNIQRHIAPVLLTQSSLDQAFLSRLPFALTSAQERVVSEIRVDLATSKPMLRLVQGDVGSGKTVVAALAILQAVGSGYQAALMAPTELLAEQHYKNFVNWLEPLGINVVNLTGKSSTVVRRKNLERIASGDAAVVIGTHALFQKTVIFARLSLVVVDEQHRFGVEQRLSLAQKGQEGEWFPHQLIMTATPIPRTLAMTAYADLDYSVLNELPPGRKPISTLLICASRREEVIEYIRLVSGDGKQAYWVCTLISESEALQCQAVQIAAQHLMEALPEIRIGVIHGRLKSQEKEEIMLAFRDHELDVLVATTVIEVGVDVPNATLMVIENPERLGLAQLHQLRGRVGRGKEASHCILLYQPPLSFIAKQRLQVLKMNQDGFIVAQKDLELRGPGEVLGTRQTGLLQLKVADLLRDKGLLPQVQAACEFLLKNHMECIPLLTQRWVSVGEKYSKV